MGDHDEQVLAFVEITQADPDLAAVFLKHNDWEIAPAVEEYMNNPGRYMVEAGAADADETVRQPLAPIVSRLADDEYDPSVRRRGKRKRVEQAQSGASEGIFDALRDLKSEADYFKHLKNVEKPEHIKHQQKLADLYRPPHAIITHGNFEEVNEIARTANKWLLVNVHQSSEFECLRINRDVWSKQPIQQLVRDYFVLWYIYTGTSTAKHYTSYYTATDWPHVAVLDPCTGERLAVFEGSKYSEGSALDEALNAFVAKHIAELSARTITGGAVMDKNNSNKSASDTSTINTTDSSEGRAVKRRRLADDEEERMMNMAIMASLGEEGTGDGDDHGTDGEHKESSHSNNNHSATSDAMKSSQSGVSDSNNNTSNSNNNNKSTHNTSITSSNNNAASTPNTHSITTTTTSNSNTISNTTTVVDDHVTAQNRILSRNNSNITINSNAVTTANTSTPSSSLSSSSAPQLQIQLRLPSSRTQPLSYSADTPLHVLLSDVAALLHLSASRAVTLSSNYPRRTFTAQQGTQSLSALGIEHKSVLFVDVSE